MTDDNPFSIDIGGLKSRDKTPTKKAAAQVEQVAEELGFRSRTPAKKRGRKPSPRTGQVHARVMPNVSEEISEEAKRRGVQQGVLIEEAWALYKESMEADG